MIPFPVLSKPLMISLVYRYNIAINKNLDNTIVES